MATKIVEWGAKLNDMISGPAEQAARALDDLADSMKADQAEIAQMRKQMAMLKMGGKQFTDQMKELKLRIDAKKQAIAQTQAQYIKLGGKMDMTRHRAITLREALKDLRTGLGNMPGPAGQFFNSLQRIYDQVPKSKLRIIGLGLALASLGAAYVYTAKQLGGYAIEAQNTRRNELLLLEAHTRVRNLWGFPPGKSKDMQASIDRIAPSVSIARGEILGLQTQLYQAGLRGKNLDMVLEAAAIKQSALGGNAGAAFADFASAVRLAGGSAERAAKDVKNRFGDVVAAKMKSLEVQTLKQKENIDSLFADVDVEPFLKELQKLRDIFNVNTAAGESLKRMITSFLGPVMSFVNSALVAVRRFFKQVLIGAMEIKIGLKTIYIWWLRTFGPETEGLFTKFTKSVMWGKVLVWVLTAAVLKLAFAFGLAAWPILAVVAVLYGLYQAFNVLFTTPWGELGEFVWDGITGGMKRAWEKTKKAFKAMVHDLQQVFVRGMRIHSPSRVFAELGAEIPRGITVGINSTAPEAKAAVDKIVPKPELQAPKIEPVAPQQKQQPTAARGGTTLTIGSITVNAASGEPKDVAQALRRELEQVLAGLATQMGAAT